MFTPIVKLRQGLGKGQARMARMARMGKDGKDGKDGQGWTRMALKVKGLKALKPLPRAYTKVGCHPPTHPEVSWPIKINSYFSSIN